MKNFFVFFIIFFLKWYILNAETIKIPNDFETIQEGIDIAVFGDTVLVAPGTYTTTSEYLFNTSSVNVCVSLKSGVVVISEAGPEFTEITNDSAFAIIVIDNITDTTTVLKGFTIQGPYFRILCRNKSNPVLEDNIIKSLHSVSNDDGLGMGIGDSSGIIVRNNIFREQELAIIIEGASPRIENNIFDSNHRGIQIESSFQFNTSEPIIINNQFKNTKYTPLSITTSDADVFISGNIFYNSGDIGIRIFEGKALITKNIFSHNHTAISAEYNAEAMIINCTIYGDSIGLRGNEKTQLCNSIIWNSTIPIDTNFTIAPVVAYSDIQEGWPGTGNKDTDPLFMHPDTLNFSLQDNSQCIDSGQDIIFTIQGDTIIIKDFKGNKPDMGAIESSFTLSLNQNSKDISDPFILYLNYPNPFNPLTVISWQLASDSYVDLSIYNNLGQKVCTLISQKQNSGFHEVTWDASGFPSGMYFFCLKAGDYVQTKRMLLIK